MNKKIKIYGFILLLSFLSITLFSENTIAHSPQDMQLYYNEISNTLTVRITHRISDFKNNTNPETHYIYKILIEKNDFFYYQYNYGTQNGTEIFTYTYIVNASDGDILKVTAFCFHDNSTIARSIVVDINLPPNKPINVYPDDKNESVSYQSILSWECTDPDGDDLTYDVYLGLSIPPELVSKNQT